MVSRVRWTLSYNFTFGLFLFVGKGLLNCQNSVKTL